MAAAGLVETATPRRGDVGLVVDARGHHALAIHTGTAWAGKARRGIVIEGFRTVVAWSV